MQSLEAACEEADHILHIATKFPHTVPPCLDQKNGKAFFSIHQKLRELYEEQCIKDKHQPNKHFKSCSHLLDKLVAREHLNTLIVNLYPGNKGYSIALRIHSKSTAIASTSTSATTVPAESVVETMRWPYHEDELLRYIDQEELPPMLVDLLETTHSDLFYSGCIIAEVRDYRQAYPHLLCRTHHVLLRPTTQSMVSDVNLLTAGGDWTNEEKLTLESQLVLATQGPLCLDPSPSAAIICNRMNYNSKPFSTESIRRCARRFSQVAVNRKRKLDQFSANHNLPLYDFLSRRRAKTRNVPTSSAKLPKKGCENGPMLPQPPPTPADQTPELSVPEGGVDVLALARSYERPRESSDYTPQLVEEHVLETEREHGRIYHIKLSILQRPSNSEYLGELYVDRDYREGERNGAACRFCLGTRAHANRYIQQFTEIFTEEGRKSVRITHIIPGQPPRVRCTVGMLERDAKAALQHQLQQQQQQQQQQQLLQQQQQQQAQQPQVHVQVPSSQQLQNQVFSVLSSPTNIVGANVNTSSINNVSVTSPNMTNGIQVASNLVGGATVLSNSVNSLPVMAAPPMVGSAQHGINNGNIISPLTQQHSSQLQAGPSPTPAKPPSTSRHITNPAISALVTSLMNSAQQFQVQQAAAASAAAAAAAAAAASSTSGTPCITSTPNSAQVSTASSNNAAILSLLNNNNLNTAQVINNNTNTPSANAQTFNQKILAQKMTLTNLLNSRLLNHNNLTNNSGVSTSGNPLVQNNLGAQQTAQHQVRVTLSSLSSPPPSTPPPQSQAFTISANNSGYTASNVGFTTVPINASNVGTPKAPAQQSVTLNHSGRLLTTSPSAGAVRRLSAGETNSSGNASNLGLSMPGLSALLAGTPSADNPIPGSTNSASSLLERLTASSVTSGTTPSSPYSVPLPSSSPVPLQFASPSPKSQFLAQSPSAKFPLQSPKAPPATPSPLSSPPQTSVNLNLQGLSLASLQGAMASIPGLQNVQVSIPGLAVPISLSLNVSTQSAHPTGVIVTTLPITSPTATCSTTTPMMSTSAGMATSPLASSSSNSTMVLTNTTPGSTGPVLTLPVAQLVASGVKGLNQQNLRTSGPAGSVSITQGSRQSIQLVGLQRPRGIVSSSQLAPANKQALAARGILKVAPNSASAQLASATITGPGVASNQVVTLTAQQQLQFALQKQHLQLQQCLSQSQQKATVSPAAVASKHRRRSNAADPNK